MPGNKKNVLFIALSGIGNFIMQLPTIKALKKNFPEAHITAWVAPRGTKALAEAHPAIDAVIEARFKNNIVGHISTTYLLQTTRSNIAIMLFPGQHWKGASYMWIAGVRQRIGHQYPWCGNATSSFLLTDSVAVQDNLHDVAQNLRLLEPLGMRHEELGIRHYEFSIPIRNQQLADELFHRIDTSKHERVVGFHMGSSADLMAKRWPLERFIDVGKKLIAHQPTHILLFGGPDEAELKQEARQALGDDASTIDADLLTTAGVMKRCDLLFSNDSGLMHLAAAVGTKTYGLFGPTNEKRTGPRGVDSHVIRALGTQPVFDVNTNFDLGDKPHETILAITPEMVVAQLERDFS